MMRTIPLLSLSLLAALLGGCQTGSSHEATGNRIAQQTGAGQTLTAADNGTTVSPSVGEVLSVSLHGNASTGYSWAPSESGAPVLALTANTVSASDTSATGLVGAPETTTWTFTVRQAGEAALKFEYRRPWEKDTAPAQTFEAQIKAAE